MTGTIYMNNAATSWPKPRCVADAVAETLSKIPGSAHRGGIDHRDVFSDTRRALAKLIGVSDPDTIALGANATWGLNLAIGGFPLAPGDSVVTSAAEHNSVLRPLYKLSQRGVKIIHVPTDAFGRIQPELWEAAIRENRPKLCVFTHASNVTGAVNDGQVLAQIAKKHGAAVLLDTAQSLGCVPVLAEGWGVDMLAFTGHKYLMGPQGTGGLYVRPGLNLQPVFVGGTGVHSDMDTMPPEMPLHLEAGTGNEPGFAGLAAALLWSEQNPADFDEITRRTETLKAGLQAAGARVIAPPGVCTPVVSFTLPGLSAEDVGYILSSGCDIVCRSGLHCAPKIFPCLGVPSTVRLSLSRFTTDEEGKIAIDAVKDIIETEKPHEI